MGGGSGQLQYWWQVCWKTWCPEIHRRINDLPEKHPDKLWINELEFAAIIVNIFAASTALESGHMQFTWQPLLHMGGDNKSANCWATKFSNSNRFARKLTKLLAMAQKYLGINIIIEHVIGKFKGLTDAVSRGQPSVTLGIHLKKDFTTNASTFACLQVSPAVNQVVLKQYQPSPDLLSHIECILLGNDTDDLPLLCKSNWGQIVPEQTITFDFAANNCSWTLA